MHDTLIYGTFKERMDNSMEIRAIQEDAGEMETSLRQLLDEHEKAIKATDAAIRELMSRFEALARCFEHANERKPVHYDNC